MIRLLAWLLFVSSAFGAATHIGSNALVSLPSSALYSGPLNFRPGDGETITNINPPYFQWPYCPNPRLMHSDANDLGMKNFILTVATDSALSEVKLKITNAFNFISTLAPFTNLNVPLYWKVDYCNGRTTTAFTNSVTNSFTISPDAVSWDRSILKSNHVSSVLSNKTHPFIMITDANRLSASNFLFNTCLASYYASSHTNPVLYDVGNGFRTITNIAGRAITNTAYWPTNMGGGYSGNFISGESSIDVGNVALMWALTRSATWSNAHPEVAVVKLAEYYMTNQIGGLKPGYLSDVIGDAKYDAMERAIALGYDWTWELMTTEQRTNVLYALASRSRYMLRGESTWAYDGAHTAYDDGVGDPTGAYTNTSGVFTNIVRPWSAMKWGHSHGTDNGNNALVMALAGAIDGDPWCREMFDYSVNYMLGNAYIYDQNMGVGRPYTLVHMFENKMLNAHIFFQCALPEAGFTNNPAWKRYAEFWDHSLPVAFNQAHEPWGDTTYGQENFWQDDRLGRFLALWLGDARYYQHWTKERDRWRGPLNHSPYADTFWTAMMPFHFDYYNTNRTDTAETNLFMVNQGWVASATGSPSQESSQTNGVGFFFQARPAGSITGHGLPSDGSFQIWAYGAAVTDGGGLDQTGGYCEYEKVPWSHYTLTVNGLGQCQPQYRTLEPWYGRISAYTNGSGFTYAAADLTRLYARSNFTAGGDTVPSAFATLHSGGPSPYITNVTRQMLFNRGKYFVIYDTLQTSNNPTNVFHWVYHVQMSNSFTLDASAKTFSYISTNTLGSNVTTYVMHNYSPSGMGVTNFTTTNTLRSNPLTGENYWTNGAGNFGDKWPRYTTLWFSNSVPTNSWRFMSVIYPVKWGDTAPTITRVTDNTVRVQQGSDDDVVSFGETNSSPASTLIVALAESGESGGGGEAAATSSVNVSGGVTLQGGVTLR